MVMKMLKKIYWFIQGRCTECGDELEPPYSWKIQYCVRGHLN